MTCTEATVLLVMFVLSVVAFCFMGYRASIWKQRHDWCAEELRQAKRFLELDRP